MGESAAIISEIDFEGRRQHSNTFQRFDKVVDLRVKRSCTAITAYRRHSIDARTVPRHQNGKGS
jgi:hypothetical protein